ncbi:MAG: hypothetical protein EOP85_07505 [Verrucomicrobiaceae bacterium]|nr:MAG: hypothetical protein EOP85_07505 [Verrucomicrobiaceae bacterium]
MTLSGMMTREELAQRINAFEKDNRKREWPLLALVIGGVILVACLTIRFTSVSPVIGTAGLLMMLAAVLVPGILLGAVNRKRIRKLGLHCPECDCILAGPVGRMAVTTCHCSQCGKRIVE